MGLIMSENIEVERPRMGQGEQSERSQTVASDVAPDLHKVFDPVVSTPLPIYFGPLLGELFLADLS